MRYLKQNTATRVTVGPFFDKGDAITPETALTVTNCKLTLMVDDAGVPTLVLDAAATASGGNNDMVHVTNDDAGFYDLELTAAQTNYVGRAMLAITDAANHCPVFHEFMIVPANVYDSLFGTDKLDVNAAECGGTTVTGRDIGASVLLSSGTGTGQVSLSNGTVALQTDQAVNVTKVDGVALGTHAAGLMPADVRDIAGAAVNTAAAQLGVNVIQVGGTTQTAGDVIQRIGVPVTSVSADLAAVKGETASILADTGTDGVVVAASSKTGYALSAAGVQAIWDALTSALTTVGSIGKRIVDYLDAAVSSRSTYAGADTSGTTTLLSRIVGTLASGTHNAQSGDAYARLGAPAGASTAADIAAVKAETASIKTKTDNLPAAPAATGDIPSAATVASQVRTELTTELGRIDAAVTTRAAASTAMSNATWTDARAAKLDNLDAAVTTRATPAQVNTEVLDVLTVDTFAEPSGVPAATSTLKDKLAWLFTLGRNKRTQTATTATVRNDGDSGNVGTATVSDDGTTFTQGEWN